MVDCLLPGAGVDLGLCDDTQIGHIRDRGERFSTKPIGR